MIQRSGTSSHNDVLLWDCVEPAPNFGGRDVWCWRHYSDGALSVPRHLEQHAERLRARYLAFIHDLGQTVVNGRRVVEHMSLPDGFSFWWMTLLAEKSPLKSMRIYDALRLLALEEMLVERRPARLILHSADRPLVVAVQSLCVNLGLPFKWERGPQSKARKSMLRAAYRKLPYTLQGVVVAGLQIRRQWPLRRLEKPKWFDGQDALFCCSYFVHLDARSCADGKFHSHQWEGLPEHLRSQGRKLNWIQHFLFSPVVPDTGTGVEWVRHFNRDAVRQGLHAFLDTFLSARVLITALKHWCWLNFLSVRLRRIPDAFKPKGSAVTLWPLLKHDWFSSVRGPTAAINCLWHALFESALGAMPRQETGLYIYENQAWERAFLHAWKRHGHGKIIGVQHATAPFWHLYYFDDRRSLRRDVPQPMPQADCIAVNGAMVKRDFIQAGQVPERLVEVEALRYLGLTALARGASARRAPHSPLRVLILGDMVESSMHHLLGMVEDAAISLGAAYHFTFKSHPYFPVSLTRYPGLVAATIADPLHRILADYDVAVSANSTSAAVDAYVAGLDAIIAIDGASLNLSPLRGQPGVTFVGDAAELMTALRSALARTSNENAIAVADSDSARADFFCLNPLLSRWTALLSL